MQHVQYYIHALYIYKWDIYYTKPNLYIGAN